MGELLCAGANPTVSSGADNIAMIVDTQLQQIQRSVNGGQPPAVAGLLLQYQDRLQCVKNVLATAREDWPAPTLPTLPTEPILPLASDLSVAELKCSKTTVRKSVRPQDGACGSCRVR